MFGSEQGLAMAVPNGQRYSCQQCGWCCRWWKIQVTPEERDRLIAHNWGAFSPRLKGVDLFWRHHVPGEPRPTIQIAQIRHRCVFLEDDGLCVIHKVLGEEAKPSTCRRFPLVPGFVNFEPLVAMDYSCSAVVRSEGQPASEMAAEASHWLAEAARSMHHQSEPRPLLDETLQLSWRGYQQLEARLLEVVRREEDPISSKLAMGTSTISSVSGIDDTEDDSSLAGRLAVMIADVETPHSPTTGRGSRSIGYALSVASQAGSVRLSTLGQTVNLETASRVECDLDSPEFDDYLTRFITSYILAKSLLKSATIRDGWAYLKVCIALVGWYAAASAAISGRPVANLEDVATGIQVVGKAFVP